MLKALEESIKKDLMSEKKPIQVGLLISHNPRQIHLHLIRYPLAGRKQ